MRKHRFLYPAEIAGIIDMPHEVNVVGHDINRVEMGGCCSHDTFDIREMPLRYIPIATKT